MENVEKHIKMLGRLYIAAGIMFLFPALIVEAASMLPGMFSGDLKAFLILTTIFSMMSLLLICMAVPCFIGGYYLIKRRQWARTLLIILGVLNLLDFPIGTALGVYTLWVLLNDQAKHVYAQFT